MTEPTQRLQPAQPGLERPKPQTIQPHQETPFPQASVEQLANRTETEKTEQEWKELTEYVLLKMEGDRILDGLETISALESGAPAGKMGTPNFKEAQTVMLEWQQAFPGKELTELVMDIQTRIRNDLGKEAANLAAAGIEVPTGVKFDAIEDYLITTPRAERLLKGLSQALEEHPAATPERARAQHYLVNEKLRTPQEGIQRVRETMQKKIDILQRLGIQVP